MTDKERIKELLVGMANSDWCDNAAKRKIRNEILPLIDSLPGKPELTEFERAIHRGFLCAGVKELKKIEQKSAWSKDDDYNFASAFGCVAFCQERAIDKTSYERCLSWLKSLKDRVLPQPKQEWREEDLYEIKHALFGTYAVDVATRLLNKIKSLRPQNRWKPSDEQINALGFFIDCVVPDEFNYKKQTLKDLLEQLKKLREE